MPGGEDETNSSPLGGLKFSERLYCYCFDGSPPAIIF